MNFKEINKATGTMEGYALVKSCDKKVSKNGSTYLDMVLADKSKSTYLYDGSLVMGNLMLAAYDQGLGSCWIHRAKEEFESEEGKAILRELGIEGDYEGIGHCVLGYAAQPLPAPSPRKDHYVYYIK